MKFLVLALLTLVPSLAHAETVPTRISYLNCTGYQPGVGSVTFIYTGKDFNITEVSAFGVPFSQQAEVVSVQALSSNKLVFNLRGRVLGIDYKLVVNSAGESRAYSGENSMQVVCAGDIRGL